MNQGDRQAGMSGEEEQARITTYEEAFKRIKEATGVSDTQVKTSLSKIMFKLIVVPPRFPKLNG